jgi:cell division protein FtsZ
MGTGEAEGDNRALEAAQQAINNPLLDGVSMAGAKGVIISITGGEDMRLMEVDEAANHIRELVDPDANIIWGSAFNSNLDGKIRVSVVATGIDGGAQAAPAVQPSRSFAFQPTVRPVAEPAPVFDLAEAEPAVEAETVAEEADVTEFADAATPGFSEDAAVPVASYDDMTGEVETAGEQMDAADEGDDELVLGGSDAPVDDAAPVYGSLSTPAAAPSDDADAPLRPAAGGGTLFERMSRLSRGTAAKNEEDGDGDGDGGVDIPRFLNRQNNQ